MTSLDGLLEDIESQREFFRERVPVYARLLGFLPDVLPRERLEEAWTGREFGAIYERPLLILGGLRDDAFEEGSGHPLWGAIAVPEADLEQGTRDALEAALAPDRPVWRKLRARHVQTNATSRAVAWLWPARLLATAAPRRPLQLFDVGTSAGLNLVADSLPSRWSFNGGTPLPTTPLPPVTVRRGYDLRPLDVGEEANARWLRACIWPGQTERESRLQRAIEIWRSCDPRPEVVQARAGDVPALLPRDGECMLAVQTVMRDYLPSEERQRYEAGMRDWVDSSPGTAVWVELEVTEAALNGGQGPPAAITAHLPGATLVLATCEPHPVALNVDEDAVRELVARLD